MAVTVRSAASDANYYTDVQGNCVVTKPAGVVDGDLLFAFSGQDDSAGTALADLLAPGVGWGEIGAQYNTTCGSFKVFQRVADSEPASYTFPRHANVDGVAGVIAITAGTYNFDTPLVAVPTFATGTSNVTSHVASAVTGAVSGLLVCAFFGGTNSEAARTHTTPASMTEQFDANAAGWITLSTDTQALASSASTGTRTSTCSAACRYLTVSLVVKPLILVAQAVTDTLTIGVTDTVALVVPVNKAVTDTLTIGVTDTVAKQVTFGPTVGTWTSPTQALPEFPIAGSSLFWDATVPAGAAVAVMTSIDNAASWQPASNGGAVPNLPIGSDSVRAVIVRVTSTRSDAALVASPKLHRLELRIAIDGSVDEWCQLGRFFIDDSEIVDDGTSLVLRLTGADLSRKVAMNTWDETLIVAEGTNGRDAIVAVISNRWPEAVFNLASTEYTVPRLFYGEAGKDAGNPWSDAQAIARDLGWELFLDAFGVVTSRPVPDPDVQPAVWTVTDSVHPTMIDLSRRMTNEDTFNQVIVNGESSSNDVPVTAFWRDLDPTSKTVWGGRYGKRTKTIRSDKVSTTAQAQQVADAEGLKVKGATEIVRISMLTCPFLDPGDVIEVDRTHSKTIGRFAIDGWHIALGPDEELMSVNCRRQRQ
jgi:hypothetical protein